jgi:hypothetical protein
LAGVPRSFAPRRRTRRRRRDDQSQIERRRIHEQFARFDAALDGEFSAWNLPIRLQL